MNLKSAPVTILLGAVGLVLLTALGWVALIGPAVGAVHDADDEAVNAADRNFAMSAQLTKLRDQAEKLTDTDKLAARLDAMFPPTADQPGFFSQVRDAADKSGISADDITQLDVAVPAFPLKEGETAPDPSAVPEDGPEPQVGDVAEQLVTIAVTGGYDQLTELMAHLETTERAFLVDSVTVATSDEEGDDRLTITVVGDTFVAPPLGDSPGGKR